MWSQTLDQATLSLAAVYPQTTQQPAEVIRQPYLAAVFPQATPSPELFRQTDAETSSWRGGPRGVAPALATLSYAAIDDLGSHI